MKLKNVMLPMMAILFAIGMSFATVGLEVDPQNDYIQRNGNWEALPEQECGQGTENCRVIVDGQGPFLLYDSQSLSSLKKSDGDIIIIP
ncbi:DUF6520 family protein [Salegentibacter sp. F14]